MKKTILVTILTVAMLLATIGSVNAAKVETNLSKVEAGKEVEVTISTDASVEAISFNLEYPDKFEYVETKSTLTNGTPNPNYAPNTVRVSLADADSKNATKTVTVVFRAKENAEEAKDLEFKVTNLVNSAREELTSDVAKIEIVKAEETKDPTDPKDPTNPTDPKDPTNPTNPKDPTNPTDPKDPTNPTDPKDPSNPTDPKDPSNPTDINGKPIEEHPATGTPLYIGAVAVIVIAAGAVLVIRNRK